MNSEPSSSANGPSSVWRALPAQTAGILAASILLGLAYNSASPLRVREMRPDEISAPQAVTNSVTQPATVRTGYFSEPRSLTSQVPATAAPKPTPTQVSPAVAPSAAGAPLVIPEVKWPEVKALVDDGKIVLVDARLQANYDLGHIPGAVLLPATSLAPELQAFAAKYPKDTALVTYCSSDTCHMSRQLAEALVKICGFTNVREMPGGYAEYLAAQSSPAPLSQ